MKIILAKPDNISDHIQPSIGLGILANILRKNHQVILLDFLKEKINKKKLYKILKNEEPDVIGFQCYTFDIFKVREYAQMIREHFPNIKIILGGPHPSTLPEETILFFKDSIDYIFLSEAEYSLKKFCDGAPIEEIKGIGYLDKKTNKPVYSYPEFENDLDKFGMPAWDMIKPETYPPAQHGAFYKNFPIAPIILTRGCPFRCTFCAGNLIMGRKIRKRSPDSIIEEILYLYKNHNIHEFHFINDNFTQNRQFAIEILKKLKALNLNI
ncbi:MAG TPA: cobalamin-dependent protein, partial [bacterium]|nr:cobalamin-dependent protein [bacterium]